MNEKKKNDVTLKIPDIPDILKKIILNSLKKELNMELSSMDQIDDL